MAMNRCPVTPSDAADAKNRMGAAIILGPATAGSVRPACRGESCRSRQHSSAAGVHGDPGAGPILRHDVREGLRARVRRPLGGKAPPGHGLRVHGDVELAPTGLERRGRKGVGHQEVPGEARSTRPRGTPPTAASVPPQGRQARLEGRQRTHCGVEAGTGARGQCHRGPRLLKPVSVTHGPMPGQRKMGAALAGQGR